MDQHFKTMDVLQGHTLSTEAITENVGTLIISQAGNEGEEINKQPIIMIKYQRFVLGHTPIKMNFKSVRSNSMNLLYLFLMSNSCWEEVSSYELHTECPSFLYLSIFGDLKASMEECYTFTPALSTPHFNTY